MAKKPEECLSPEMRPFYTKDEIVSELIWIQEFLDEMQAYGWSEADYPDLARKYSSSIDKILMSIKPEIFDPASASPYADGIFKKTTR